MKTIGFKEDHDFDIVKKPFIDAQEELEDVLIDETEQSKIINYLKSSDQVFGMTLALFDGDNYIGPYMIFSDGTWLWPGHFPYHLSKSSFSLGFRKEFLLHIRESEYISKPLTKELRNEIIVFLEKELLSTK